MRRATKQLRLLELHLKEASNAWEVEQGHGQEIARAFRKLKHACSVRDHEAMLKAADHLVCALLRRVVQ